MLDLSSPNKILEEVEVAEKVRDAHMAVVPELVAMYTGPDYSSDQPEFAPAPENHPFEWISWIMPKIVEDNPRVTVNARGSGVARDMPLRLEHGSNQWSASTVLWKQLQQVFVDLSFCFGVMRVGVGPIPGYRGAEKRHWGAAVRTAPDRYVIDTRRVSSQLEARFQGHNWFRDKDDLLRSKMPGLDKKVIAGMQPDRELEKFERNAPPAGGRPDRKEIVGWELWVPEFELPKARVNAWRKTTRQRAESDDVELPDDFEDDEQLNGTIFTLGCCQQGDRRGKAGWLREPRPYWGPACGPYELFGVYIVPGQVYPLSPLVATANELREVNAHAHAMSVGAANWKKYTVVDAANPAAVKAAQNAEHGDTVAIQDADKAIKTIETGGVDPKQFEYFAFLRERLQRRTGQNDGSRGEVKGDPTATEYADVAAQRESRIALIRSLFAEHTRGVLYRGAWILYHCEFARFDLPPEAVADLKPRPQSLPPEDQAETIAMEMLAGKRPLPPGWDELPVETVVQLVKQSLAHNPKLQFPTDEAGFDDWSMADISGIPFDQLELSIDPMSMGRVDQAMLMRLAQDRTKMVTETAPLMEKTPWIKWQKHYDDYGDAHNVPNFSSIIDMEALRRRWEANQMAEQQAQQAAMMKQGMMAGAPGSTGGVAGAPNPSMVPGAETVDPTAAGVVEDQDMMSATVAGRSGGGGYPGNFSGAQLAAVAR